jgi:hypothetical protein
MHVRTGQRLRSAACTTEVMVLRAPPEELDLRCGGRPMREALSARSGESLDPGFAHGTELGKRYVSDDGGLELLCVKAGTGSVSLGSAVLSVKAPKPLPASD